ncbi:MAG: hypothetical protein JWR83_3528 [Aeromicrobium sp.]|nr:hypothetical protein [Aeromicrobium sp.]
MTHSQVATPAIESSHRLRVIALSAVAAFSLLLAAFWVAPSAHAAATPLVGTFKLKGGACSGGKITGTYLRMILPSGGPSGPYMSNSDSKCSDQSFTPLQPGTDGGLFGGSYQANPSPAFDSAGNARSGRVTAPARFYGTGFATSTNSVDPQTKTHVAAPRILTNGGVLSADLRAFSVSWNKQYFNQGSPKPSGAYPGNTRAATGTYNASTGAFTLNWTSQVVGGPFDKFTGQWHLEGQFVPANGTSTGSSGSGGTGGTGTGSTGTGGAAGTTGGATGSVTPGADPSTAPGGTAADSTTAAGATTQVGTTRNVVTKDGWKASPVVIGLAAGIAVLGFGALIALQLLGRRKQEEATA